MISYYLDNIFVITIIIIFSAMLIMILGVVAVRRNQITARYDFLNKQFIVSVVSILIMVGVATPIAISVLIKLQPNIIEEFKPYANYATVFFSIMLVIVNIRRFKLIDAYNSIKTNTNLTSENKARQLSISYKKVNNYTEIIFWIFSLATASIVLSNLDALL